MKIIWKWIVAVLVVSLSFFGWWFWFEKGRNLDRNEAPILSGHDQSSTNEQKQSDDLMGNFITDTSNWETYRNEKLGFEFKLSDEYSIPENEKNIVGKKKNTSLLDPKKTEYLFNSRQGLEQIKINAGMSDAADGWNIRLKTYSYSKLIESNLEEWVKQNGKASFDEVGKRTLKNGSEVVYASWNSICSDYSAFFIQKNYILEFNTCASSYFSSVYGDREDYFSSILNSVRF